MLAKLAIVFSLAVTATMAAPPAPPPPPGPPGPSGPPGAPASCGKYNILFTGLPAYHPDVIAQGYDPAVVDAGLNAQLAALVEAGYNTKEIFYGPEEGMKPLADEMKLRKYDGIVLGFGERGDGRPDQTIHFENKINFLRERYPNTRFMFNYDPTSTLWAVERNFPVGSCTNKPGIDYGKTVVCSVC